jgi:hypothetical protein
VILAQRKLDGRTTFRGLDISIENKVGSVREGVDKHTGKEWSVVMKYPYGYIRMTEGVDGDHVDCFIGPNEDAEFVYVIHQNDVHTGKYDEDKCMLGFDSLDAAKKAYHANYTLPEKLRSKLIRSVDTIPFEKFKEKVLATRGKPTQIAAQRMSRMMSATELFAKLPKDGNPGG